MTQSDKSQNVPMHQDPEEDAELNRVAAEQMREPELIEVSLDSLLKNAEDWDNGNLGNDEQFVVKSTHSSNEAIKMALKK